LNFSDATTEAGLSAKLGLQGLKSVDRQCVKKVPAATITGSIDLDDTFRAAEAQANRWDYGVGFSLAGIDYATWIEPHSATSVSEISTMIRKLQWLRDKLGTDDFDHLRRLTEKTRAAGLRQYWWVTLGKISFRPGTNDANRLARAGLNFPRRAVTLGKD
jgi:hypothetical protein